MDLKSKSRFPITFKLTCALAIGVLWTGCGEPQNKDVPEKIEAPLASASDALIEPVAELKDTKIQTIDSSLVRSADRHVHGGATLSIVSEGNAIQIEFETPLYNLLGFEYVPETDTEKALVSNVETNLMEPQRLFRFNDDAKCAFNLPSPQVTLFKTHSEIGYDEDHHGHDQDAGHEHSDHHEIEAESEGREHDEPHQHEDEESHQDVHLTYTSRCQGIEELKTVEVKLFETFPNLVELELVYLGLSHQMSTDLTPSNATADLRR